MVIVAIKRYKYITIYHFLVTIMSVYSTTTHCTNCNINIVGSTFTNYIVSAYDTCSKHKHYLCNICRIACRYKLRENYVRNKVITNAINKEIKLLSNVNKFIITIPATSLIN